jgi:hypothetical protein
MLRHMTIEFLAAVLYGAIAAAAAPAAAPITLGFVTSYYTMYASIGGGPVHRVQLDTGSLGLFVPKNVLGPDARVSSTERCTINYVSSGNILSGYRATARVTLLGKLASGDVNPPPSTVEMPLCAVDTPATFKGGMMGVGFGRGDLRRNVLLQMEDVVSGKVRAGYILGTHPQPHVVIGLDASHAEGFQKIRLKADESRNGDWHRDSLRGCISLPNNPHFALECGRLLVDTGISSCILWGPRDPTLGGTVPDGETTVPKGVAVEIRPEGLDRGLKYTFLAGAPPNSPSSVRIRNATTFSINTGRNLLLDYDYLFDAAGGYVGFRLWAVNGVR